MVAAFHELDERFSKGEPVRLRLLARKGATPAMASDPAEALKRVIETVVGLKQLAI